MIVVGVDPGKEGALAFVRDDGAALSALPTPLITSAKGRSEYDERSMREILRSHYDGGMEQFIRDSGHVVECWGCLLYPTGHWWSCPDSWAIPAETAS